LDRGTPAPGESRIGDRDYARVPALKRFPAEACGKAGFIVRAGWNAFLLTTPHGWAFDLIDYLQKLSTDTKPHEVNVRAEAARLAPRRPGRAHRETDVRPGRRDAVPDRSHGDLGRRAGREDRGVPNTRHQDAYATAPAANQGNSRRNPRDT
jgi:hypothetical protein